MKDSRAGSELVRPELVRRMREAHEEILDSVWSVMFGVGAPMRDAPEESKRLWMDSASKVMTWELDAWSNMLPTSEREGELCGKLGEDAAANGLSLNEISRGMSAGCTALVRGYWSIATPGDHSALVAYTTWNGQVTKNTQRMLREGYHATVKSRGRVEMAQRAFFESLLVGAPCAELAHAAGTQMAPAYLVVMLPPMHISPGAFPRDVLLSTSNRSVIALFPTIDTPNAWLRAELHAQRCAQVAGRSPRVVVARSRTPSDIPQAVADAERALVLAAALSVTGVVRPESLWMEHVLAGDTALRRDVARIVEPLLDQPDLLGTLRKLYEFDLDRSRSATRLGIHRRTLSYRLEKITTLTGLDPVSSDGIKTFQLAIAALHLSGGVPEAFALNADADSGEEDRAAS